MGYNVLTAVADKTRTVGLGEAALYAALGFAIVFLGIAFLIFVVWLVGKAMNKTGSSSPAVKAEPIQSKPTLVTTTETNEVSDETVAVIMAALMAYYQQNNPKCEFTVKRIKRI